MGVDIYYCPKCKECLHHDCFSQCEICSERSNNCQSCEDIDNYILKDLFICNNCISKFNEDNKIEFSTTYMDTKILKSIAKVNKFKKQMKKIQIKKFGLNNKSDGLIIN